MSRIIGTTGFGIHVPAGHLSDLESLHGHTDRSANVTQFCTQCKGIADFIGTSMHKGLSEGYQCRDCNHIDEIYEQEENLLKEWWWAQNLDDEWIGEN